MTEREAPYFVNHDRRDRFPWTIYHRELQRGLADAVRDHGPTPRVLVVGCGLEPFVPGGPPGAIYFGFDLHARAIEECRRRRPEMAARLAVCPGPLELPREGEMSGDFDVVVAKEVIEHLPDPEPWARALAKRVAVGGELALTTPNYGRWSPLPILERTVLEWIARRDGYSRAHIHPSKFDRRRLEALELDPGMTLHGVTVARTGLHLLGRWQRLAPAP
ncbi:MAG: methyltransferase domain-containing protein [Kofleriaceae bacterium]|nr:MAG: methyltransferase domain-containing protein [Kofleriaceae bacterium]